MNTFQIDKEHEIRLVNGEWIIHKSGVPQDEIPDQLTKYYALTKNSLDSIETGYFFLQNPVNFNDPFDCCANLILERRVKPVSGQPVPPINDIPNIGVSCFSTEDADPLMWAHYTRSYTGFALTFNTQFFTVAIPEIQTHVLSRVIYSDNPNPVSEKLPFAEHYRLCVKLKNWQYENEWRLIVQKADEHLDFSRFYFSQKSLREIIVGYKFDPMRNSAGSELQERFWAIIKKRYPGVPIYQVGPSEDSFNLYKRKLVFAEDINDLS